MNRVLTFAMMLIAIAVATSGCDDEYDFTSDASCHLSYSGDTLQFEPLLATRVTATHTIMVYNHSGEDLKVNEIELHSANGNFQINVDGRTGTRFSDVEIPDGDSIYIFVRAKVPEQSVDTAVLIQDSITFSYNGNHDRIVLSAYSQNANIMQGQTIKHDTTWTNAKPFLILDSLRIAKGATLTIEQGSIVLLHNGASITVDGTLDVKGTASAPVLIGGDRYDNLTSMIPYNRLSKQWGGINISASSSGNHIEGTLIRSSTYGITIDSAPLPTDGSYRLTIANSEIRTASEGVLYANHANIYAYNTVLANGGYRTVYLRGGQYLFNHCTIACYSSGNRMLGALTLQGDATNPLTQADFNNCIVYGSYTNELNLPTLASATTANYKFSHCLIRNNKPNDTERFTDNIWSKDPKFTIDGSYLYYDFHLKDSTSAAYGIGDTLLLTQYPECATDLDANPRTSGNHIQPDAGAYSWVKK